MTKTLDEIREEFWQMVSIGEPDECWPWKGAISPSLGYGTFKVRAYGFDHAHRTAWELTHGKITDCDICVLHTCDYRPCCNVLRHLFLGNRRKNAEDRHSKGRSRNGNRKLTETEVREISELYRDPTSSLTALAKKFDVSPLQIKRVVTGEQWKKVDLERQLIHIPPARRTYSDDFITAVLEEYESGSDPLSHVAKRHGISQAQLQHLASERGIVIRRAFRKLNLESADKIRSLYGTGRYTYFDLADMYGVCYSMIGRVVLGKALQR